MEVQGKKDSTNQKGDTDLGRGTGRKKIQEHYTFRCMLWPYIFVESWEHDII